MVYYTNNYSSLVLMLINFHIAMRLISSHSNLHDITHIEAYGYLLVVYTFFKLLYDAYREQYIFIGSSIIDTYSSIVMFTVLLMTYVTEYLAIRVGIYTYSLFAQSLTFGFYTGCIVSDLLLMTLFPIDSSTKTIHDLVVICRVLIVFTSINGN